MKKLILALVALFPLQAYAGWTQVSGQPSFISARTAGQSGALVIGLGVNQIVSVAIDGPLQRNRWMKVTTANTVGTPTFTMRSEQTEEVQP